VIKRLTYFEFKGKYSNVKMGVNNIE